jgi:hypothetical protein
MSTQVKIGQLTMETGELLKTLKQLAPKHSLCIFDTSKDDMVTFELATKHFYNRFLQNDKPVTTLTHAEQYLAWFNFRCELEAAVTMTKASISCKEKS